MLTYFNSPRSGGNRLELLIRPNRFNSAVIDLGCFLYVAQPGVGSNANGHASEWQAAFFYRNFYISYGNLCRLYEDTLIQTEVSLSSVGFCLLPMQFPKHNVDKVKDALI